MGRFLQYIIAHGIARAEGAACLGHAPTVFLEHTLWPRGILSRSAYQSFWFVGHAGYPSSVANAKTL